MKKRENLKSVTDAQNICREATEANADAQDDVALGHALVNGMLTQTLQHFALKIKSLHLVEISILNA